MAFHPSIVIWGGNNENEIAMNWFKESRAARDVYVQARTLASEPGRSSFSHISSHVWKLPHRQAAIIGTCHTWTVSQRSRRG